MADIFDVTVSIEVLDQAALHQCAIDHYRKNNPNAEQHEIDDHFGPAEEINVSACLIEMVDPGVSPDGTEISK